VKKQRLKPDNKHPLNALQIVGEKAEENKPSWGESVKERKYVNHGIRPRSSATASVAASIFW
jgi:hypothetical protein